MPNLRTERDMICARRVERQLETITCLQEYIDKLQKENTKLKDEVHRLKLENEDMAFLLK